MRVPHRGRGRGPQRRRGRREIRGRGRPRDHTGTRGPCGAGGSRGGERMWRGRS
ncbi:unnamed protein product [Spirodela intermedia]|uniref:Uncharacterized protein n=1 Tax=Spirodela intermedia TaxID=51605 RepID=A0A7I8LEI3_SPIIN|nr:unnamed protein product [Spirodela intermedia]